MTIVVVSQLLVPLAGLFAWVSVWCRQPSRAVSHDRAQDSSRPDYGLLPFASWWLGVIGVGFVLAPLLGAAVLFGVYSRSIARRRAATREREREIRDGLAQTIDLFSIALAGGHNLYEATRLVADWADDAFGTVLAGSVADTDGRPLADRLEGAADELGASARPLVAALVAHDRYGAPIAQNLTVLAAESRRMQRHQAEVVARRLPVVLLGPLVACVLPAFLLLTVVPLVADTVITISRSF